jgi:sulfur-oxidizing protein SoxX
MLSLAASACRAQSVLDADIAVDASTANKTMAPRVAPNSGKLMWTEHRIDLTRWPSLDPHDARSIPPPAMAHFLPPLNGDVDRGRAIAIEPTRGNCVACHALPKDVWPGEVGPSLLHMKARGLTDEQLYQRVFDARIVNRHTVMPPFGAFGTLTDQDIRDVAAFLKSIE